jgi:hypothetical protein
LKSLAKLLAAPNVASHKTESAMGAVKAAIAYAITAERLKELGFEGVLRPMTVSCADHDGTI